MGGGAMPGGIIGITNPGLGANPPAQKGRKVMGVDPRGKQHMAPI